MKNMDDLSKGYTPLIVGIVLYILLLMISHVTQNLDYFGILLVIMEYMIIPVIIGYLTRDYVRAIIYTIVSVIVLAIIGHVINPGVFSFTGLLIGLVIVAVFSVVGVLLEARFAPKSTNTSPTS
jgi:FtsH-binding integral membrane protein